MAEQWVRGPVGMGSDATVTRSGLRNVLVLVPHLVAGTRLLDLLRLFEGDKRVQVVFTVPSTLATWRGAAELVVAQGGVLLPWHQATQTGFDLVLAAGSLGVFDVRGPVLYVPHGGGFAQYRFRPRRSGHVQPVAGLDRQFLMRDGAVRPAAIVLTHEWERAVLREWCPEAVDRAVVAGDIALDRLVASVPFRDSYRAALGVSAGQRTVVVSSTWTSQSAFGRHPDLFERLMAELPSADYRVVALLHPNIWCNHGAWQVRAWLADSVRAGLVLVPPEDGWRAALVAADLVIGDYGSVTQYAAAIHRPVLLAATPDDDYLPGSPAAAVRRTAPGFRLDRPLLPQVRDAVDHTRRSGIADLLTSEPGRAGRILRRTMYRLLGLSEPAREVHTAAVSLPHPVAW
ncbi:hypothetical protein [Actinocrispum wychmicini]|uniref:CDP-glycerol glycerophosphotransferase (TagB/SpsB family) n=1 Tax=Actinocrispum wychmicini TaxID=1213861 RepID=A0A4R2K2M7_9PSEU|nr:hypothetical protein [Actinocrispum wychmicini]TCO60555.1 hypothetical protein EV192_103130 [Actinocrispum wychmicini]